MAHAGAEAARSGGSLGIRELGLQREKGKVSPHHHPEANFQRGLGMEKLLEDFVP